MDRIAGEITKALVEKLPGGQPTYSPEKLRELDFPYLIVEKLKTDLIQKAIRDLQTPDNDWIDTEHPKFSDAWEAFQSGIPKWVVLSAEFAETVIRSAVTDCLNLVLKPRTSIPAYIFGDNLKLDAGTVYQRASSVVINRHLALSLYRYMEKKGKKEISYEDAESVLEKIDKKLVENYNPLNWQELLKPLFAIAGPAVPTGLLRIFFEEKGKEHVAKNFDRLSGTVTETEFIEMLSSADFLDFEGYEKEQTLFDVQPQKESPVSHKEDAVTENSVEGTPDESVADETGETIEPEPVEEEKEADLNALYREQDEEAQEEDEHDLIEAEKQEAEESEILENQQEQTEEEESGLNAMFGSPAEDEDKEDDTAVLFREDDEKEEKMNDVEIVEEEEVKEEEPEGEAADLNRLYGEPEEEPEDDSPVLWGLDDDEPDETPEAEKELNKENSEPGEDTEPEKAEDENLLIEILDEDDEYNDISDTVPFTLDKEMEREEIELNSLFRIPGESGDEPNEDETESEHSGFTFTEEDEFVENVETDTEPAMEKEEVQVDKKENNEEDDENPDEPLQLISEPDEPEEETLLSRFMFDDTVDDEPAEETEKKEPSTIYDELNLVKGDSKPGMVKSLFDDVETEAEKPEGEESGTDEEEDTAEGFKWARDVEPAEVQDNRQELPEIEEPEGEDNDVPMWQSFLDRSDIDDDSGMTLDPGDEAKDEFEEEFIEEPIFDLTKEEPTVEEVIADLSEWIDDDRERFVDEIFAGSDTAYEQTLAEIMNFDNWREASRYIERQVFTRNRVDLYSEVAVDFTDRLHTYFIEHKS